MARRGALGALLLLCAAVAVCAAVAARAEDTGGGGAEAEAAARLEAALGGLSGWLQQHGGAAVTRVGLVAVRDRPLLVATEDAEANAAVVKLPFDTLVTSNELAARSPVVAAFADELALSESERLILHLAELLVEKPAKWAPMLALVAYADSLNSPVLWTKEGLALLDGSDALTVVQLRRERLTYLYGKVKELCETKQELCGAADVEALARAFVFVIGNSQFVVEGDKTTAVITPLSPFAVVANCTSNVRFAMKREDDGSTSLYLVPVRSVAKGEPICLAVPAGVTDHVATFGVARAVEHGDCLLEVGAFRDDEPLSSVRRALLERHGLREESAYRVTSAAREGGGLPEALLVHARIVAMQGDELGSGNFSRPVSLRNELHAYRFVAALLRARIDALGGTAAADAEAVAGAASLFEPRVTGALVREATRSLLVEQMVALSRLWTSFFLHGFESAHESVH